MDFKQKYQDYILSREGLQVNEFDDGFLTFKFEDSESVYLADIYLVPESRSQGRCIEVFSKFEQEMKEIGKKNIFGSAAFSDPHSTRMVKIMIKNGFKLFSSDGELLFLKKELL